MCWQMRGVGVRLWGERWLSGSRDRQKAGRDVETQKDRQRDEQRHRITETQRETPGEMKRDRNEGRKVGIETWAERHIGDRDRVGRGGWQGRQGRKGPGAGQGAGRGLELLGPTAVVSQWVYVLGSRLRLLGFIDS